MQRNSRRFAAIAVGLIVIVIVICIGMAGYRAWTPTGWVMFSSPDGNFIGQRLYMLAVARPAEDSDEETQKFFSSFKLSSLKP